LYGIYETSIHTGGFGVDKTIGRTIARVTIVTAKADTEPISAIFFFFSIFLNHSHPGLEFFENFYSIFYGSCVAFLLTLTLGSVVLN